MAVDFFAGAFFAGAFLAEDFFAGAFFAGAFLAGAFFADDFFAGAFFAGAFFAGAFFAEEVDAAAGAEDAVLTGTAVATGLAAFLLFTARLMDEMNAFTTEKLPVHTRQTMDWTSGTPVVEPEGST